MHQAFEAITAAIIDAIEAGTERYQMPWHQSGTGPPVNALTKRAYRGSNILSLWAAAAGRGFTSNRWGTYRQWSQLGAQVRKGETGTCVIYWQINVADEGADADEKDKNAHRIFARAAKVFNLDQVDGAPEVEPVTPLEPAARIALAQTFFDALPAVVHHRGDQAYFDPRTDAITLPVFGAFRTAAGYYSVRSHETVHWSGAKQRLDRDLSGRFGSAAYSAEELIAEFGAAFLCAHLQIATEPRLDHAPYIADWLQVLRNDPRALINAASQAQAAVDYLIALAAPAADTPAAAALVAEAA